MTGHFTTVSIARMDAAIRKYENGDSSYEANCVRAIFDNRPAWWSTSHQVGAMQFMNKLNFDRGLASFADYPTIEVLDTLVPLNAAAVEELQIAYAVRGEPKEADELDTRHTDPEEV